MERAATLHLFELTGESRAAHEGKDVDITGLTSDSRDVRPGYLFAALDGSRARGADFIPEALRLGATAVLAPPGTAFDGAAPNAAQLVTDDNPRRRFAEMAARFFLHQPRTIAAVTGTNGKTSTVTFLRELWRSSGRRAASLGGLGVEGDGPLSSAALTTPDPVNLHQTLAALAEAEVAHCAMEASSHGLDQYRLDGVRLAAAAFLNLTRDHLDYHRDLETYFTAKARLFAEVMQPGGDAVLNADSPYRSRIEEICRNRNHRVLLFGESEGDVRLVARSDEDLGQRIKLELLGQPYDLLISLPGAFQAYNLMAAAGLALATGMSPDEIAAGLPQLTGVRGRLELAARLENGAPIFVDYAHTPDALEAALRGLRPNVGGRLIVLFGCGGDRDAGKRPQMGGIASDLADVVYVSDDNPRYEDPASIRSEILGACPDAIEIGGRGEAIAAAIAEMQEDDLLLIAGKGHEQGQSIKERMIPFDDGETVRRVVMAQSHCRQERGYE
ncbi:MAG: UDP-N-acetylmuramoyl-L-alanyl-D-glutamate--2,6-diaminopimelate ligase [Rhodospirillaceae bacterium]|jgi:UDP-N-acetylmuramoyl-L-alanyl-D-glutamate--2,6-diaminopimelate ligase|nr:UDP-N-acetylmuramoyl-L-alanyl-D-glutamate--2,6-diaminopimelate ligase [Rhodospirillaceae bacterium]MBT4428332.1 UDP-N-acetylmuramoyl-L-alanyl-D-glutamate--2,6-diaminopimelate ligase [Rhodospirillaceae bacterium]MBT5674795.1 UDP-N-acetylmuramoyl-L-alanyl-D-glutamate--2,6-diaminopimelate ligase [Rhodospirillaceae bacterium]MBT5778464.1 UDP-N-acetylmuramoyl-L-alanyl-D-glutamate--2,6-diaminopimelate ligase [Rhodospirillaceae bacterium]